MTVEGRELVYEAEKLKQETKHKEEKKEYCFTPDPKAWHRINSWGVFVFDEGNFYSSRLQIITEKREEGHCYKSFLCSLR